MSFNSQPAGVCGTRPSHPSGMFSSWTSFTRRTTRAGVSHASGSCDRATACASATTASRSEAG